MRTCPRTGRQRLGCRASGVDKETPASSLKLRGSAARAIDANLWPSPRTIFHALGRAQGEGSGVEIETAEENEIISFTAVELQEQCALRCRGVSKCWDSMTTRKRPVNTR